MDSAFPEYRGRLCYTCLVCHSEYAINELVYACPACSGVLLLEDKSFDQLRLRSGQDWRSLFDFRASVKNPALKGIFRFYELMAPVLEAEDIVYLGEGNTPIVEASPALQGRIGRAFAFKNDGQNPSASFKDRGMACAFSYLRALIRKYNWPDLLTICASTGDTSASAALYAAYVGPPIKSVVLLPQGKVTPQQLSQPLGNGALVLELPGVFDDCMKVVERLAERYRVALLNSKNSWRILGQESYAYEAAQWYDWDMAQRCFFVPVGNAGNITALLSGFLKLKSLGIIDQLPRIFGVQSAHADPVFRYYALPPDERRFQPVQVQASVAQAAMIGNPVSFPRVRYLAEQYCSVGGDRAFQILQVNEQDIMDSMLEANRHGHNVCTQGGECLAGLKVAVAQGFMAEDESALLDATAHVLKFLDFQTAYFTDSLDTAFGITPKKALQNAPRSLFKAAEKAILHSDDFVNEAAERLADLLSLRRRSG